MQELALRVALADLGEPDEMVRDGVVMRVEQPAPCEERMPERLANGALGHLPEFGPGNEHGVDVHTVCVQRQAGRIEHLVVDRHEHEVDVRLCPDGVVGEAAAEDGREDGPVVPHLLDQAVERLRERLADRDGAHAGSMRRASGCRHSGCSRLSS